MSFLKFRYKYGIMFLLLSLLLQACSGSKSVPLQGDFNSGTEPSIATASEFGTIINIGKASVFAPRTPRHGIVGMTTSVIVGSLGAEERDGIELTVEMDSGKIISVMQYNDEYFATNDRVRIIHNPDGSMRAIH